jgi:hypothetical protein
MINCRTLIKDSILECVTTFTKLNHRFITRGNNENVSNNMEMCQVEATLPDEPEIPLRKPTKQSLYAMAAP